MLSSSASSALKNNLGNLLVKESQKCLEALNNESSRVESSWKFWKVSMPAIKLSSLRVVASISSHKAFCLAWMCRIWFLWFYGFRFMFVIKAKNSFLRFSRVLWEFCSLSLAFVPETIKAFCREVWALFGSDVRWDWFLWLLHKLAYRARLSQPTHNTKPILASRFINFWWISVQVKIPLSTVAKDLMGDEDFHPKIPFSYDNALRSQTQSRNSITARIAAFKDKSPRSHVAY